jgi:hypothetical protein
VYDVEIERINRRALKHGADATDHDEIDAVSAKDAQDCQKISRIRGRHAASAPSLHAVATLPAVRWA